VLLDLYELTMAQSYLEQGLASAPATFSLFAPPADRLGVSPCRRAR
jgi:nicotinic acid phosphoribosyltransferase